MKNVYSSVYSVERVINKACSGYLKGSFSLAASPITSASALVQLRSLIKAASNALFRLMRHIQEIQ
jgi:hypothetical protein